MIPENWGNLYRWPGRRDCGGFTVTARVDNNPDLALMQVALALSVIAFAMLKKTRRDPETGRAHVF